MAVGVHLKIGDWDNKAFELYQAYMKFCELAQTLSGYLAPLSDQEVADRTGYSLADVGDLKAGCNVANAMRLLSLGDTSAGVVTQASQVSVFVGKFGGT